MNILVREATVEDAHAIVTAEKEIAKTPGYFHSQPDELSEENVIKMITKLRQSKKEIYFVVEQDKVIRGHAFLEPLHLKSICHVAQLSTGVHKGWQEKGIGTALMERDMCNELFEHPQKLSFKFYDEHKTGQLMTRIYSRE